MVFTFLFRERLYLKKIVYGCIVKSAILYKGKKWVKFYTIDAKVRLEDHENQAKSNFIDNLGMIFKSFLYNIFNFSID